MMHPGVNDSVIYNITTDILGCTIKHKVKILLNGLKNGGSEQERVSYLNSLVDILTTYEIRSFDETSWYFNFTCRYILLKNLPACLHQGIINLLKHTFQIHPTEWEICPVRLHILAKSMFADLNDDYNLMYVVNKIAIYSRLSFYVSLALVWAALFRYANIEFRMFRLYKLNAFTHLLKDYEYNKINDNLIEFYRFINLSSLMQNMQILNNPQFKHPDCFNEFFIVDPYDVMHMIKWLEDVKMIIDNIIRIKIRNSTENLLDDASTSTFAPIAGTGITPAHTMPSTVTTAKMYNLLEFDIIARLKSVIKDYPN